MIAYLIKMLVCSGVLYGYYVLALKNNSFHRWNRGYLLLATITSILLPLLQFSFASAAAPAYTGPLVTVYAYMTSTAQKAGASNFASWIPPGIYALIALLLIVNMLRNWLLIKRLTRQGKQVSFDSYLLINHPQVKSTFSFFSVIFWGDELTPDSEEGKQVLRHELEHIRGRHTADKLFLQLVCAVFWFNPFLHLFKRELAMVHEFLADKAVAAENAPDDYARTLLQMTLQTKRMLIANSFTQAPVKRRILMLFSQKANYALMKKIIIFPVLVFLGFIIGCQQDLDLQSPVKRSTALINTSASAVNAPSDEVFSFVSDPPKFPGGDKELARFLSRSIHYPKKAQTNNTTGTVLVKFVVNSAGKISEVTTEGKFLGNGLEEESMRVVAAMPDWIPGEQEGRKVSVEFHLPIRYVLQ
ncbi:M56 family metallopeptidase [Chitinophaga ginsengisoli]|uniref:Outer membrane transport energization protein TonB n=1 Tax=Chitinophaga ginsengisoli TaxID=363837 RepID=A0A2P8GCZ2_9BACT|nr:M56 family metallopeptidase [Chitinophaga ginsengisoli]PSL31842.1 outer membrane transport energization protein TonB [Chitinophaga ginsengisoli]